MSDLYIYDLYGLRDLAHLPRYRALWLGDDGALRIGRSGDVVTMLDDLNIVSTLYYPAIITDYTSC